MRGLKTLLQASQKTICKLTLYDCDLSGFRLGDCELPALQLLSVHFGDVDHITFKQLIQSAYNLEILTCAMIKTWPADVVFSPSLRVIVLFGCYIKDTLFCSLVHSCPLLEVVRLADCPLLTEVNIIELVQHAKHLNALYLSENRNFTDAALEAIAVHCGERLKHLCLYYCESVTNTGLQHLSKYCHQLEGLGIGFFRNEHIATAAIQTILYTNPLLQEVTIAWDKDADTLLEALAENCTQLRYLDISLLHGYTVEGVSAIISSSTTGILHYVRTNPECTIINDVVKYLWQEEYCPDLEFLDVSSSVLPFWKQYQAWQRVY